MNRIIEFLSRHKNARYGTIAIAAFMAGNWTATQYPEESVAFWAQPLISLVMAIFALYGGKLATANWNEKVDEAEKRVPAGMTVVEALPGDKPL